MVDTAGCPKGWGVYAPADDDMIFKEYHIAPLEDLKKHILVGCTCWCEPKENLINDTQTIVVHNSADGREILEQKAERLM